jgi:hypothetical protein
VTGFDEDRAYDEVLEKLEACQDEAYQVRLLLIDSESIQCARDKERKVN